MNNQIEDIQYKSGWRPIIREDDLNIASTNKNENKTDNHANRTDNSVTQNDEIKKMFADISTQINELHNCIIDRNNKIDDLISLLKEGEVSGKNSYFKFLKK